MANTIATGNIEHRNDKLSCKLKIVLLGDSSVGKSSILTRYIVGEFQRSNATIGAAFMTKDIPLSENKIVNMELWDTAGQERYRSLASMYYRGTDVAIIVYDVTSPISLQHAKAWIHELKLYIETERGSFLKIILVGNKTDLVKDYIQPKEVNETQNDGFYVVSAKNGDGVDELFNGIIKVIPDEMFVSRVNSNNEIVDISHKKSITNINLDSCSC